MDLPTLIALATLVMALTAVALTAHWLVNREMDGLATVAGAFGIASFGMFLLIPWGGGPMAFTVLLAELLILIGQMWFWLGTAAFWGKRTMGLTYLAGFIMATAIVTMTYQVAVVDGSSVRGTLFSTFSVLFSMGAVGTLLQVAGGRTGLYKGVLKRTALGIALTVLVLVGNAVFQVMRGLEAYYRPVDITYAIDPVISPFAAFTHVEAIIFSVSLMLAIIVMTTERIQSDLRIQAMTDALTGALNRRAFMAVIKTVLARAKRTNEPVSLIMLDIDKFKQVNVVHGHPVGDAVLTDFAKLVMLGRREQDVFCRFGGEEFLLLLPGTPEEGAQLVAERIRAAVTPEALSQARAEINLTLSIGVMTARGDDLDFDYMLNAAYKMLRVAQKVGLHKIAVAGSPGIAKAIL